MSFRRPKSEQSRLQKEWQLWINAHQSTLQEIGLPPEVYLNQEHWEDFLENGHLHWHTGSGFEFDKHLDPQHRESLRVFLERECKSQPPPSLLNWLRVQGGVSENS